LTKSTACEANSANNSPVETMHLNSEMQNDTAHNYAHTHHVLVTRQFTDKPIRGLVHSQTG